MSLYVEQIFNSLGLNLSPRVKLLRRPLNRGTPHVSSPFFPCRLLPATRFVTQNEFKSKICIVFILINPFEKESLSGVCVSLMVKIFHKNILKQILNKET